MQKNNGLPRESKIRTRNTQHIMSIAEQVFANKGYGGATTQEIADRSELPKANVHYYFPSKKDLYLAVLNDIFNVWKHDADIFEQHLCAKKTLTAYIECKLNHSFTRPYASKVWASEIIQGAPIMGIHLKKDLVSWNNRKVRQIQHWIDTKEILPTDPQTLLYTIWSTTQHYADFDYQIKVLNGDKKLSKIQQSRTLENVTQIILRGVGIDTTNSPDFS